MVLHSKNLINEILTRNIFLKNHIFIVIIYSLVYYYLAHTKRFGTNEDDRFKTYTNSLYYTIVTHFTIGYGDISPKTRTFKMLCCTQILCAFMFMNL